MRRLPGVALLLALTFAVSACASSQRAISSGPRPIRVAEENLSRPPTLPSHAGPNSGFRFRCPKKPGTTVAIEACLAEKGFRQDRKFNRTVAALWPLMTTTQRRSFDRAQNDWLRYMNHQCKADVLRYAGGTIVPVYLALCELRVTAGRLKDVEMTYQLYHQGR